MPVIKITDQSDRSEDVVDDAVSYTQKIYNVAVFGSKNSGKTSLITQYMAGFYIQGTHPGFFSPPNKVLPFPNDKINLQLKVFESHCLELEELPRLRFSKEIPYASIIILTFDLTDKKSLEVLSEQLKLINMYQGNHAVVALVGTKCDGDVVISQKEIDRFLEDSRLFAVDIYAKTSAKENINLASLFLAATKLCLQKNNLIAPEPTTDDKQAKTPKSGDCSLM